MNISFKTLSLIIAASTSQLFSISQESIANCYKDELQNQWKYIEYIFVVQPGNKLANLTQKAQATTLTAGAIAVLARNPISRTVTKSKADVTFNIPDTIASALLAIAGYYVYICNVENNIKHETLVNFLHNWEYHKQFTPASLAPAFDELAAAFNASPTKKFSNAQVSQIFEIIRHLLEHTFKDRYSKKDAKDADMLTTVKTITEIGKNLSGSK